MAEPTTIALLKGAVHRVFAQDILHRQTGGIDPVRAQSINVGRARFAGEDRQDDRSEQIGFSGCIPAAVLQRTVSLVRYRTTEWGIDPNRIGIFGFSVGGHLGVAMELHVYAHGGHGFGVPKGSLPCSTWTDHCVAWPQNQNILGTRTK